MFLLSGYIIEIYKEKNIDAEMEQIITNCIKFDG